MSEEFEQAHEHLEHAADGHSSKGHTRPAIIIAIMAAALALTEFAAKDAQTNYLTNHIAASDTWAQYQAKAVRRTVLISEAELLQSLPAANDPQVQKRIADAQANAGRMRSEPGADGMDQLAERAHEQEHLRDHAMHRTHELEIASGGSADFHRPGFHLSGRRAAAILNRQYCPGALFRNLRAACRPIRLVVRC